jgi:hypothetical protein
MRYLATFLIGGLAGAYAASYAFMTAIRADPDWFKEAGDRLRMGHSIKRMRGIGERRVKREVKQ